MIEKTVEEFKAGEYIAFYETSIDGIRYLKTVCHIGAIRTEWDKPNARIFSLKELDFNDKPYRLLSHWTYPKVQGEYESHVYPNNKLLKQVATAEIDDFYTWRMVNESI